MKRTLRLGWYLGVVTALSLLAQQTIHAGDRSNGVDAFEIDAGGSLQRPTDYREWIFVGTPLTPNDMNNGKAAFPEFHSVYIHPSAWEQWKEFGRFPEGTILVKELISVGTKQAASGAGYFMGDFIGLEAAIKSERHFPDAPGNWGYFSFSSPDHRSLLSSTTAEPAANCNSCHQTRAQDDWVFTQHYPVMRSAKAAGERAGGGHDDRLKP